MLYPIKTLSYISFILYMLYFVYVLLCVCSIIYKIFYYVYPIKGDLVVILTLQRLLHHIYSSCLKFIQKIHLSLIRCKKKQFGKSISE